MDYLDVKDKVFESIKHIDENGVKYWSARELYKVLEYTEYSKFKNTINKAISACNNSKVDINNHFAHVSEMVALGSISFFV